MKSYYITMNIVFESSDWYSARFVSILKLYFSKRINKATMLNIINCSLMVFVFVYLKDSFTKLLQIIQYFIILNDDNNDKHLFITSMCTRDN